MRTRDEVSREKLRGGFYTPPALVALCLQRASALASDRGPLRVLEPTAGDGVFIEGLLADSSPFRGRALRVDAIELVPEEAEKARAALARAGAAGEVRCGSALDLLGGSDGPCFDVALGNPPFVRFQFLSEQDKQAARALARELGFRFEGVGNLWIPVLLATLGRLRAGGAFAFVLPMEVLHGIAAGAVREWLLRRCDRVQLDLFAPGSFPGVLQEVGVLSGRIAPRAAPECRLVLSEHVAGQELWLTDHRAHARPDSWTRYLLDRFELDALCAAIEAPAVHALGHFATFEVSTVTGANDYFTLTEDEVEARGLRPWAVPLLPRIRHAPGLVYDDADHRRAMAARARTSLLHFTGDSPDPASSERASAYIATGESRGLARRYKCRIREPWYRVPDVAPGEMLLSKRSHEHPRMVLNDLGVRTTDTIYRGRMLADALSAADLVAGFHNSLTLLSAELEGRSFGGGVLELVPSEIRRLAVIASSGAREWLPALDRAARAGSSLIAATDARIAPALGDDRDALVVLAKARRRLWHRRQDRNRMGRARLAAA